MLLVADVPESNPLTAHHLEVTFDKELVEIVSVENGGFCRGISFMNQATMRATRPAG